MFLNNQLGCVLVVIITVVHYSCGQCTGQYCEDGHTTDLYQNLMEQNNYLMQEIKKIGKEVRKNGEEVKVIKDEVQSSRGEINKTRKDMNKIREEVRKNGEEVRKNQEQVRKVEDQIANFTCTTNNYHIQSNSSWKHCGDVYKSGYEESGVYKIKPSASLIPVDVYCDHSNGGGWTMFQRRLDGKVLFNRTWEEYKQGFGNLQTELWMGNHMLSLMSLETDNTLRIDLVDFDWDTRYAQYTNFKVQPENQNYKLQIGTYSGTAGNGLSYHNKMQFSTIDRDNDLAGRHCVTSVGGDGGWWYRHCTSVNLNGYYKHHIHPGSVPRWYIVWPAWKGEENLQRTMMRLRPSNF